MRLNRYPDLAEITYSKYQAICGATPHVERASLPADQQLGVLLLTMHEHSSLPPTV